MQLAHAGDDRLLRLFVGAHPERRIFLREARQREAELVLVGLALRLDRLMDDRLGERDRLERDRRLLVAERVAGARVGQADRRRDVARADRVDVLAMVGVHPQDAPDALLASRARVVGRSCPCSSTPE